jgi:arsenate reductase
MNKTPEPERIYNVLFLCTGNSARSILAECILAREGRGRFRSFSAGSRPKGAVPPYALDLLKKENYPTAALRSKSWDEFAVPGAPSLDLVFTVCDNVTGPEAVRRAAFADAMRMLRNRISVFVDLPIPSLDKLSLQKRLDQIGRMPGRTAPVAD